MVFQDGGNYVKPMASSVCPSCSTISFTKRKCPSPSASSSTPAKSPPPSPGKLPVKNRSFEYDTLSDPYARFLLEEFLPEVARNHNLADDPESRAICGISSGGICAWTVAYPALIRKTPPKPIRVFLQDGANDLDNEHGNWPLVNQEMAAAIKFAKYNCKFVFGDGAHNGKHGGAILPDSLRWLWLNYQAK